MQLKNYFIMPANRHYSLKEDYVLALIELNSDSKVSHISRSKIQQLTGIKDPKTITRMTNKFQKDGFITKVNNYINQKNLVEYHLNKSKYYICCLNSILQFKELGIFAIKLAEYRINGSPCIYMSDNELIKALHIKRATYFAYKKALIKENILIEDTDCYILSSEYFPIFNKVSESTKNKINHLLESDKAFKGRKVFLDYYKNNFANLKCSIDYFVDYCLAGCPSIKKENKQEEINILI